MRTHTDSDGAGLPSKVTVCEVGTRDGFQMEHRFIPTETKVEIVNALIGAGVRHFEVTSFVSPRTVPQLRDAAELMTAIGRRPDVLLTALVPNARGAERAAAAGVDAMVLFLSASESHNARNVNRSVAESLDGLRVVGRLAGEARIPVFGAISTAFGCPFEGDVPVERVIGIARAYCDLGVVRLSLGDTTGMATPPIVRRVVRALRRDVPELAIALHFHNTRGIGLANVMAGLDEGVTQYESAIGGLGGCPFAPGATGNICTEDLLYLLAECGIDTGIDLDALIRIARRVEEVVGRTLPGQVMKAGPRLRRHPLDAVAAAVG